MKKLILNIILLSFVMLISPVWAASQYYSAGVDSANWRTSGDRIECRLSQTIPGYGKATFRRKALQAMEFRVSSNSVPRKASQALIFVSPPSWKKYANRTILGRVSVSAQKDFIVVPEDWAKRMVLELREGMEAVWTHADLADGQDIVSAKILPLHFKSALHNFQQCEERLIVYGYKDVRFSALYFAKRSMFLSLKVKAYLDKLAEYASLDRDYQHIKISSHTDSRGVRGENLNVSKKRANLIKKYLVKQGVSPDRFVIIAKGEKKPKYNNRTQSGRAKNRRVEVSMVK